MLIIQFIPFLIFKNKKKVREVNPLRHYNFIGVSDEIAIAVMVMG